MDIYFYTKFWLSFKRKVLITRKLDSVYELEGLTCKTGSVPCVLKDIKLIVFDVDDTIAEHKGIIPQKTFDLFDSLKEKGYKVAVLTNCGKNRRAEINSIFGPKGIYVEPTNFKPNPWGYKQVCKKFEVSPSQASMVGEKMGTDMYGAYLAGYKERILVKPFTDVFGGKRSSLLEQFIRLLENITLK